MTNYPPSSENYMENPSARSPRSFRNQSVFQSSRQFDAYGPITSTVSLYNNTNERRMDNRFGPTMPNAPYEVNGTSQMWNAAAANAFAGAPHSLSALGLGAMAPIGSQSQLRSSRPRLGLPGSWLDQTPMPQPFANVEQSRVGQQMRQDSCNEAEDELIPTAIVIKNIPFATKKDQLVELMTQMSLPLPYAFNYHFDNGVFRGLAFANFTSAAETAAVIAHLNHFELQGRKLRVEYKKMLPPDERDRIEKEKRWRRGQLEEQHRSNPNQLQNRPSVSSLASHQLPGSSPSPVSQHGAKPNYDLNDQQTLNFYTELVVFKNDPNRETLVMSPSLSPEHRRTIHALAHNLNLHHTSHGTGDQRQVHIMKYPTGTKVSPPRQTFSSNVHGQESMRSRGLNRAATTDFAEARQQESAAFGGLRGQSSVGLLGVLEPSTGFGNSANLRSAKSFADLRSYTPSPAPSAASFPPAFQTNGARYQQMDGAASSCTPTLTPTASKLHHEDSQLSNGLGGLSLGTGLGSSGSPHRVRNMFSWEGAQQYPTTAPIGSNRTIGTGFDTGSQDRLPSRQPRGPPSERGSGFRRQNGHHGRGSDELRGNPEIIVE